MKATLIYKKLDTLQKTLIDNPKKYTRFIIYYYIWELIVKNFFDKLIIDTLTTEENLLDFFDRNEFGIKNNQLYKKDIIDETTFYGEMKNVEVSKTIKKDFERILLDELKESEINIDIENYINVFVEVDIDIQTKFRIYSIYVRYYRTHIIKTYKTKFITQLCLLIGLLTIGIITFCLTYDKIISTLF